MRPLRKSNSAPGRFAAILLLLVFALDCAPLWAQQTQPNVTSGFDGQPVSRVDIAARPDVNLDELRRLIKQEAGKPFSTEAMHESVAALQDTKLFTQVQVSLEPEQDGLRVLFILQPADYIGMIDFQGTGTRFPYTELLQAVNIPEQSPYVPDLAAQGQKGLLDYLHARGFFAAEVESEAHRDGNHRIVNLIFRCQLKRQAKIRTIAFNGLTPQQSADVQAALRGLWPKLRRVSLKPGIELFRTADQEVDPVRPQAFAKAGPARPSDPAQSTAIRRGLQQRGCDLCGDAGTESFRPRRGRESFPSKFAEAHSHIRRRCRRSGSGR